jgi:sugar/nucleoside kinase (ribokinase family)
VEDIRYDLLAEARLFHFGYPPLMTRMYADGGHELAEMCQRAKETGVTTSLDLAMPDPAGPSGQVDWQLILARTLPYVDLFLPSVEELLFMLRRDRFDPLTAQVATASVLEALSVEEIVSLADEALAMGAKVVLLKMGIRGIYLRTATTLSELGRGAPTDLAAWVNRQLWAPCFRPDVVVSTVGTGDAAIAGFLAAVLRGTSPSLALNVAAATGACCVEAAGALGGTREWEETDCLLSWSPSAGCGTMAPLSGTAPPIEQVPELGELEAVQYNGRGRIQRANGTSWDVPFLFWGVYGIICRDQGLIQNEYRRE